uniref:Uncharacterized protein n=1 Tax=Bionectria ochroleuca TaxID=29856 RepID=A0A0B7K607_BIOOC
MAKVTPNLARWNWEQASSATGTLFWGTDSIPLHVQQPLMPIISRDFVKPGPNPTSDEEDEG